MTKVTNTLLHHTYYVYWSVVNLFLGGGARDQTQGLADTLALSYTPIIYIF
jgi:hypothetical protein